MFGEAGFKLFLKMIAPFFFFVGLFHLTMGLGADALMGANVSSQSMSDPGLDSQNRFYGVTLSFYGAIFWLSTSDLKRYEPALVLAMLFMFLAGLARFVSVALYGWPPLMIGLLFAAEIILPPLAWFWFRTISKETEIT